MNEVIIMILEKDRCIRWSIDRYMFLENMRIRYFKLLIALLQTTRKVLIQYKRTKSI